MSGAGRALDAENESNRAAAIKRGHTTFRYQFIDDWPGCVECGQPLRNATPQPEKLGLWRTCGCEGAEWRCLTGGWKRNDARKGI